MKKLLVAVLLVAVIFAQVQEQQITIPPNTQGEQVPIDLPLISTDEAPVTDTPNFPFSTNPSTTDPATSTISNIDPTTNSQSSSSEGEQGENKNGRHSNKQRWRSRKEDHQGENEGEAKPPVFTSIPEGNSKVFNPTPRTPEEMEQAKEWRKEHGKKKHHRRGEEAEEDETSEGTSEEEEEEEQEEEEQSLQSGEGFRGKEGRRHGKRFGGKKCRGKRVIAHVIGFIILGTLAFCCCRRCRRQRRAACDRRQPEPQVQQPVVQAIAAQQTYQRMTEEHVVVPVQVQQQQQVPISFPSANGQHMIVGVPLPQQQQQQQQQRPQGTFVAPQPVYYIQGFPQVVQPVAQPQRIELQARVSANNRYPQMQNDTEEIPLGQPMGQYNYPQRQ